jgi:hypothetical protein
MPKVDSGILEFSMWILPRMPKVPGAPIHPASVKCRDAQSGYMSCRADLGAKFDSEWGPHLSGGQPECEMLAACGKLRFDKNPLAFELQGILFRRLFRVPVRFNPAYVSAC